MSTQPFDSFRQADDFFNIYLHTTNAVNSTHSSRRANPRWNVHANGAICDRYKSYKKCIAVVNWVDIPAVGGMVSADGIGLVIRDVTNQQMNSIDSDINQTNIIYYIGASKNGNSEQHQGFPYEKMNPFGEQEMSISLTTTNIPLTSEAGVDWGIHITYYFYYN